MKGLIETFDESLLRTDSFIRFLTGEGGPGWLFWRFGQGGKPEFLNLAGVWTETKTAVMENLLQDLVYASEVVAQEDFFRYKMFIRAIREGKAASVIVRVRLGAVEDAHRWLKIGGNAGGAAAGERFGFIRDITDDVDTIHHLLEKDVERRSMIESEDLPALLADAKTGAVVARNAFAYRLFGYTFDEFNGIAFSDLLAPDGRAIASGIYEACLKEGEWNGNLGWRRKNGEVVRSSARFQVLNLRGRNLLKIVIEASHSAAAPLSDVMSEEKSGGAGFDPEHFTRELSERLSGEMTMPEILATLLEYAGAATQGKPLFQDLVCVDLHAKKGRVEIWGAGPSFEEANGNGFVNMDSAFASFAPVRGDGDEIQSVEDTLESSNPIDWALFIPHGVRSYLARTFYHGERANLLLFLCSSEPKRYGDREREWAELYFPAFLKGVKHWKKRRRKIVTNGSGANPEPIG